MPTMTKGSTLFLKVVIGLIALGAVAALIRFPQTEGRAANLDLISIYRDPVIIYMYLGSLPFFIALWQAFRLLGFIDKNEIFSQPAVAAVGKIKYCALALIGFIALAIFYIAVMARTTNEDGAGPIALGVIVIFVSIVVATAVAILQKLLQNAVDLKSENDLTV